MIAASAWAPTRTFLAGAGDVQRLIAPGQWQAAGLAGEQAVLLSCVVAPGFDFADFELEDV